jgi:zinc protease
MSQLLGELFQSRLNATIREQKGYSYGVYSQLGFGRGPGPITTGGDIKTAQTDSALVEWMKEIRGIRGDKPITDEELAAGKAALTQSLPERFSSVGAVSNAIRELYVEGLPKDYYQRFVDAVNAVTKEDVVRVARKYLDPDHLTIVIVGDRKQIEAPLAATKVAPVVVIQP